MYVNDNCRGLDNAYGVWCDTKNVRETRSLLWRLKIFFFVFLRRNLENERKNLENIGTYKIFDSILNCYVCTKDIYEDINSDHVTLKITFFTLDEIFARSERFKVGSIVSLLGFFFWKWCLYNTKYLNAYTTCFKNF